MEIGVSFWNAIAVSCACLTLMFLVLKPSRRPYLLQKGLTSSLGNDFEACSALREQDAGRPNDTQVVLVEVQWAPQAVIVWCDGMMVQQVLNSLSLCCFSMQTGQGTHPCVVHSDIVEATPNHQGPNSSSLEGWPHSLKYLERCRCQGSSPSPS